MEISEIKTFDDALAVIRQQLEIVLGISILSFALFATDRQTYRDAQGRTAGTASTSGNRTTYVYAQ